MNRSVDESFTLNNAEEFCRVFIGSFDVSIANQGTVLGTSSNKEMVNQAAKRFSRYKELSADEVTNNVKKIVEREEIRSDTLSVPDMTKCLLHLGYHLLSLLLGNGHPKTIVPSKVLVINFCFNTREGDVLRTFNRHLSLQSRRIFEVTKSGECVVLRLFKLDPYIVQLRVFVFSDSPNDLMKVVHDVISEVRGGPTCLNN